MNISSKNLIDSIQELVDHDKVLDKLSSDILLKRLSLEKDNPQSIRDWIGAFNKYIEYGIDYYHLSSEEAFEMVQQYKDVLIELVGPNNEVLKELKSDW